MSKLSPIESEFATTEEAEDYDAWFRAKVQAALDSKEPCVPHDEAMAFIKRKMEAKRAAHQLDE